MKILLAEDDTVSRLLLEAILMKLEHEFVVAVNGREAWEEFQKEYFPVVLSDWMMPELDGLALCRAIRKVHRDKYTMIIVVTVLGGKTNYLEAMDAGADDFIPKPIDADQLGARLRVAERILGLREHVKQLEGILPICSFCKRIRDGQNEWKQIEQYITQRWEAQFSHSICPECSKQHFQT